MILPGLGQILEFMYTAKLTLNPQNVEDVLAVATFLQMQEIVNACSAYKSLAAPSTSNNGQYYAKVFCSHGLLDCTYYVMCFKVVLLDFI